jgi:hypothetical protein
MSTSTDRIPDVLATDDQGAVESAAGRVVDLLGTRTLDEVAALLGPSEGPATTARRRSAAQELLLCTAMQSVNSDPSRPRIHWSLFPGARAGLDNPDTRYRFVPVHAAHRYVIEGRRHASTDVSFQLFDAWQGDGVIGEQLGFLAATELQVDDDGGFRITLDADPAGSRPNHLQLLEGAAQLTIRDTLADWSLEPMALTVQRVDSARALAAAPSSAELVEQARTRSLLQARFWPPIVDAFRGFAPNTVGSVNPTPGGLANQNSAPGRYVAGDEALVIRLGHGSAGYVGIQLGTLDFISVDYWGRSSSLNSSQLEFDPDGTCTIAVCPDDPGLPNWLDPGDHGECILFMRWQGLPAALPPEHLPRSETVQVDELAERAERSGTTFDRAAQLARRHATATRPPSSEGST